MLNTVEMHSTSSKPGLVICQAECPVGHCVVWPSEYGVTGSVLKGPGTCVKQYMRCRICELCSVMRTEAHAPELECELRHELELQTGRLAPDKGCHTQGKGSGLKLPHTLRHNPAHNNMHVMISRRHCVSCAFNI